MKRLKMLLCLTAMTVGLSATQLQANAADKQTVLEVTKSQVSETAAIQSEVTENKEDKNVIGTTISDAKATSQNAKRASTGTGYFYPASFAFNESGLIQAYTNNKIACVYLTDTTGKVLDWGYTSSAEGYHLTFAVAKGTYKICINYYDYLDGIRFNAVKKEVPTFTPSKTSAVTRDDNFYFTSTYYVKIKAKKTGLLAIKPSTSYMKMCLLNGSKKALSEEAYFSTADNATYGIKKGSTYYLKITCSDRAKYTMKFTSINEKSGSKKSKAAKLSKKNKLYYGTLLAGSNTADWYKIKLNSGKKIYVYFKPQTSDGLKISFYGTDGKRIGYEDSLSELYNGRQQKYTIYQSDWAGGKYDLNAGTYYVKVVRASKYSSGSYSIKWK